MKPFNFFRVFITQFGTCFITHTDEVKDILEDAANCNSDTNKVYFGDNSATEILVTFSLNLCIWLLYTDATILDFVTGNRLQEQIGCIYHLHILHTTRSVFATALLEKG